MAAKTTSHWVSVGCFGRGRCGRGLRGPCESRNCAGAVHPDRSHRVARSWSPLRSRPEPQGGRAPCDAGLRGVGCTHPAARRPAHLFGIGPRRGEAHRRALALVPARSPSVGWSVAWSVAWFPDFGLLEAASGRRPRVEPWSRYSTHTPVIEVLTDRALTTEMAAGVSIADRSSMTWAFRKVVLRRFAERVVTTIALSIQRLRRTPGAKRLER